MKNRSENLANRYADAGQYFLIAALPIFVLIEGRNPGESLATSNLIGSLVAGVLAAALLATWATRARLMFVGTTNERIDTIANRNPWTVVLLVSVWLLLVLSALVVGVSTDSLLTATATFSLMLGVFTIMDRWIALPRTMSAESARFTTPSDDVV